MLVGKAHDLGFEGRTVTRAIHVLFDVQTAANVAPNEVMRLCSRPCLKCRHLSVLAMGSDFGVPRASWEVTAGSSLGLELCDAETKTARVLRRHPVAGTEGGPN